MTDWPSAWTALRAMDGAAWDEEWDRLKPLWKDQYVNAFMDFAMSRPGWTEEDAVACAETEVDDALIDRAGDPAEAARADVVECENENKGT